MPSGIDQINLRSPHTARFPAPTQECCPVTHAKDMQREDLKPSWNVGSRLLDDQLLTRLEAQWHELHLPLVSRLAPGLSHREIDELTAPIGLRLPTEALVWFGWHNGTLPTTDDMDVERWFGLGRAFVPLQEAISDYEVRLSIAETACEDFDVAPSCYWNRSWFPVVGGEIALACDCSVARGAPTPIRAMDFHTMKPEEFAVVRAPSFGEMVERWIAAYEEGLWTYDATAAMWRKGQRLMTHGERISRLL